MFWHHDSRIPQFLQVSSSPCACLWRVLDQGTSRTIKESGQKLDDCERPYGNSEVKTNMRPVPFIEVNFRKRCRYCTGALHLSPAPCAVFVQPRLDLFLDQSHYVTACGIATGAQSAFVGSVSKLTTISTRSNFSKQQLCGMRQPRQRNFSAGAVRNTTTL